MGAGWLCLPAGEPQQADCTCWRWTPCSTHLRLLPPPPTPKPPHPHLNRPQFWQHLLLLQRYLVSQHGIAVAVLRQSDKRQEQRQAVAK